MKNIFLFALCAMAFGFYNFTQIDASIIGTWTQTEMVTVTKHRGTSIADTTVSHDRGFAVSFTVDSQFHYTAPYGHKADGAYTISDGILLEINKVKSASNWYKILLLTEHKMILQDTDPAKEKGTNAGTTYTYTR